MHRETVLCMMGSWTQSRCLITGAFTFPHLSSTVGFHTCYEPMEELYLTSHDFLFSPRHWWKLLRQCAPWTANALWVSSFVGYKGGFTQWIRVLAIHFLTFLQRWNVFFSPIKYISYNVCEALSSFIFLSKIGSSHSLDMKAGNNTQWHVSQSWIHPSIPWFSWQACISTTAVWRYLLRTWAESGFQPSGGEA